MLKPNWFPVVHFNSICIRSTANFKVNKEGKFWYLHEIIPCNSGKIYMYMQSSQTAQSEGTNSQNRKKTTTEMTLPSFGRTPIEYVPYLGEKMKFFSGLQITEENSAEEQNYETFF